MYINLDTHRATICNKVSNKSTESISRLLAQVTSYVVYEVNFVLLSRLVENVRTKTPGNNGDYRSAGNKAR